MTNRRLTQPRNEMLMKLKRNTSVCNNNVINKAINNVINNAINNSINIAINRL